jgi:hypothetical protein
MDIMSWLKDYYWARHYPLNYVIYLIPGKRKVTYPLDTSTQSSSAKTQDVDKKSTLLIKDNI